MKTEKRSLSMIRQVSEQESSVSKISPKLLAAYAQAIRLTDEDRRVITLFGGNGQSFRIQRAKSLLRGRA